MTADEQKIAAEEIQNLEVRINEAQQNSQIELQELEMKLMKPIFDKVKKAIDDVSIENGYTLIFDTSSGAVLYAGGDNVLDLVKEKLAAQ
jgi:outer membrane protein